MKNRENLIESKIKWIEKIPSDWSEMKVKHILFETNEKSETGSEELLSLSQYTGIELKKEKIKDKNDNLTNANSLVGYKIVKINQLVSNIMLAWNGSVAVSEYDGIISPAYCTYEFREGYNPKYFEFLFKTEPYKAEFKRKSTGIIESRLRLYTDKFYNIPVIIPPISEQNKIVDFIEFKKKQINQLIKYTSLIFGNTNPKTGLLNEYLHSLIYNIVFGYIDIKDAEIPEFVADNSYDELLEKFNIVAEDETEYETEAIENE